MDTREALEKTRAWIKAEVEKAKRPYADKFDLTSPNYCMGQAVGRGAESEAAREEILAILLRITTARKSPTHAVLSPQEILALLDEASVSL